MYKRKIISKLEKWKDNKNKKALIIEGARQVGKTFIVDWFAKKHYGNKNYIYINFDLDQSKMDIFDKDITIETIHLKLSILYREKMKSKKKVLLFLDEIQACPRAITALKSLSASNKLDVIASGSLLGVNYKHVSSFPVGYVKRITLLPFDFEEFLWAINIDKEIIQLLKNSFDTKEQVPKLIHNEFMELFKQFIVVGGMPEVIETFINTHDYDEVLDNQISILNDYKSDIAKYAIKSEKVRARECFDSIPFQLGKDNKKFQYKYITKGGRSSTYENSVQWLIDSGIVLKCSNLTTPLIPLISYKRVDAYKLYMADTGLLIAMLGVESQTKILFGDLGIAKGAIYENIIANTLKQLGYELFYYEKDSSLEIDFVIERDHLITGIEVKSANNTQSKSLKSFIKNHGGEFGIKLSSKNIYFTEQEERLPIYMAMFL